MQRAVNAADGMQRLLRWLVHRFGGKAAVLDAGGLVRSAFPADAGGAAWAESLPAAAGRDARRRPGQGVQSVLERRTRSAVLEAGLYETHVIALNDDRPGPALLVSVPGRLPIGASCLLIDAAGLLGLRWRVDEAERQRRVLAVADNRAREAVVQLLIAGATAEATRVADVLTPSLPERVCVLVVDSPPERRKDVVKRCVTASKSTAWVLRCRVYTRHTIVVAPSGAASGGRPSARTRFDAALRDLIDETSEIRIGESPGLDLGDVGIGYEQAFQAVAAQREAERHAVFDERGELPRVLGEGARLWARAHLSPLLDYVPERRQDPDSRELLSTLRAWLDFRGGAGRQLNLHRNTVNSRLRRVEALLGVTLTDLMASARLHLALRIIAEHRVPPTPDTAAPPDLAALLDTEPVRRWADELLKPIRDGRYDCLEPTLHTWLDCDANLESTAAELRVSPTGVRKRLVKLENALGRSLLKGPSARYDLAIAMSVADNHCRSRGFRPVRAPVRPM
ncbi:helix-turn-helix domain-containing protein [Streptomonospora wellingtoniae]|uniref:Helix-turn-helix domain-containing protein n=1 Tax=Streptomonospora wellingtoniae TaxID=3075544 RepID=A0ABU2KTJ2_9ACTN|nr:helix-turn-helix domain-containing protein [Streptomonospora sp. DSM 45055]MDT0302458.1 helix-turn-helix domain-containing protein [Streptomonospora sp. DSM 45055]